MDLITPIFVAVICALLGSFYNVVIFRLPQMKLEVGSPFINLLKTLSSPRSYCDHCQTPLRLTMLCPIASYLAQKGKCKFCGEKIDPSNLLVEVITVVLGLIFYYSIENTFTSISLFIFFSAGLIISVIDFKHHIIPDQITLPLIWLGLLLNLFTSFVPLSDAVIGAMFGYLLLWTLYQVHYLLRKKEGLGYGDFKLLAAIGAWFGWQVLAIVLLLASVLAIIYFAISRKKSNQAIAFGPFIILGTFLVEATPLRTILLW